MTSPNHTALQELYYRGFVQSGGLMLLQLASAVPLPLREGAAALIAAALFGLVHTEFVEEGAADATGGKGRWFRVTAAYGLAYSVLYSLSGHRLMAPLTAHAGVKTQGFVGVKATYSRE